MKARWRALPLVLLALIAVPAHAGHVNPARRWFQAAQYEAARGHSEQALSMYRELLPGHPRWLALHVAIGDAQLGLGRPTDAAVSYRAALAVSDRYLPARLGLVRALALTGDREGALAQLDEAEERHPRSEQVVLLRSTLLREAGRAAEARAAVQAARDRRPGSRALQMELARVDLALGEYEEARAAAQQAVLLRPGRAETHALLAEAYAKCGQPEEARREMDRAVALSPRDAALRESSAALYDALGLSGRAAAERGEAAHLRPAPR